MDKHLWRKVDNVIRSTSRPCPRWGHTCCVIGEEVVFFGGYADSNYMNDIWTYNSTTMKWEEIMTKGDKPTYRSNCSMNYDKENNKIVIFGGGGSNKQRFNSISILDWKTKEWIEISPKENEAAPWERTYHTAELKFPYLLVYGGEGMTDLEDLWVFNFNTLGWKEVTFPENAVRPCARRFHSSAMVGNEMYIIAGCHGKYRCLSDIYSMNLEPLLATGKVDQLRWKERKMKGNSFLTRWGHSSAVFENKIFIFGGRFSNDLNDLLVADTETDTLKTIKTGGSEAPKPRRRHCAGFIGSSMVTFGGFNGQYFNDLFYINIFELPMKSEQISICGNRQRKMLELEADLKIMTLEGQQFLAYKGLISKYFKHQEGLNNFINDLTQNYSKAELSQLFQSMYNGSGNLPLKEQHIHHHNAISQHFNKMSNIKKYLENDNKSSQILAKAHKGSQEKNISSVVNLKQNQFSQFLQSRRNHWFYDSIIIVNNKFKINVNKAHLSINSHFFKNLLSNKYNEDSSQINLEVSNLIVFEILLNFLITDFVIIPETYSSESWMELCEMSDYFSLPKLRNICEIELCSKITTSNMQELLRFSREYDLQNLSLHCADFELKTIVSRPGFKFTELNNELTCLQTKRNGDLIKLFQTLKFDLLHSQFLKLAESSSFLKKKESQSTATDEKQNRQSNFI